MRFLNPPQKERLDEKFSLVPGIIALINGGYAALHDAGFSIVAAVSLYFLVPALVLAWSRGKANIPNKWDTLVLASMALVPILLGKRFGGHVDLPFIAISAAIEGWWLWGYCRKMTGLSFKLPKLAHLALALGVTVVLCAVLMPIALKIGFPKPLPELQRAHGVSEIAKLMWNSLFAPGFMLMWIKKVIQTAVVEEILFRGLLLNMMQKRIGSGWVSILTSNLVSSALFGISHIGHGGLRYALLSFIAGIGFGGLYQVTKNLTPSTLSHGLFDTVTRLLFLMGTT